MSPTADLPTLYCLTKVLSGVEGSEKAILKNVLGNTCCHRPDPFGWTSSWPGRVIKSSIFTALVLSCSNICKIKRSLASACCIFCFRKAICARHARNAAALLLGFGAWSLATSTSLIAKSSNQSIRKESAIAAEKSGASQGQRLGKPQ